MELIPDTEQGGFTARVPDIPAYGEGVTEDEAIADLREALLAYIEEFSAEDAMARLLDLELEDPCSRKPSSSIISHPALLFSRRDSSTVDFKSFPRRTSASI